MSRRSIILWGIVEVVVGGLIIRPIEISIHLHDGYDKPESWLTYLGQAYNNIFSFNGSGQLFTIVISGFLVAALMMIVIALKSRLQIISGLTRKNRILKLIQRGKSKQVDFQSTLLWDLRQHKPVKTLELKIAKRIAGFMNTDGGNLFVGVNATGHPLGLKEDYQILKISGRDGFKQYIMQLVNSKIGTLYCSLLKIKFYEMEDKDICHITIRPSEFPVFVFKNDRPHFYIRNDKGTIELGMPETMEYIELNMNFK